MAGSTRLAWHPSLPPHGQPGDLSLPLSAAEPSASSMYAIHCCHRVAFLTGRSSSSRTRPNLAQGRQWTSLSPQECKSAGVWNVQSLRQRLTGHPNTAQHLPARDAESAPILDDQTLRVCPPGLPVEAWKIGGCVEDGVMGGESCCLLVWGRAT